MCRLRLHQMTYGPLGIRAYGCQLRRSYAAEKYGLHVKMEGVESTVSVNYWPCGFDLRIPVEHGQLHSGHVRIRKGVGLSTVHLRIERIVTHGQCREEGWGMGHLVGDVVD